MGIDYTKRPGQGQPAATPPPATTAPAAGPVSLTKGSPTVSLSKSTGASGMMRVNLNWDARPPGQSSGGFFRGVQPAIDLDLGCLYELTDGTKGCVQALGNSFRDKAPGNPIIRLDGDDRSGTNTAGENLFIDLNRLAEIKRVAVFALIYEGVPNWAAANGVVTLFPVGAPTITVRARLDPNVRHRDAGEPRWAAGHPPDGAPLRRAQADGRALRVGHAVAGGPQVAP